MKKRKPKGNALIRQLEKHWHPLYRIKGIRPTRRQMKALKALIAASDYLESQVRGAMMVPAHLQGHRPACELRPADPDSEIIAHGETTINGETLA